MEVNGRGWGLCEVALGDEGTWGVLVSLFLTISVKQKYKEPAFPQKIVEGSGEFPA